MTLIEMVLTTLALALIIGGIALNFPGSAYWQGYWYGLMKRWKEQRDENFLRGYKRSYSDDMLVPTLKELRRRNEENINRTKDNLIS